MIKIDKPKLDLESIIDECVSSMKNSKIKDNIVLSKEKIIDDSKKYDELADKEELYTIAEHSRIGGNASTADMKALYENKFVPVKQVGRKYYDAIMLAAPNDKCPYCGQRNVRTLDHYLPKSKYPTYAITPFNLVPCCSDCNKDKMVDSYNSREQQVIHPYYDDFTDEIWIRARVIEEVPITFEFYVCNPTNWDEMKYLRAQSHFKDFKLNLLYKTCSSEEYIACESRVKRVFIKGGRKASVEYLEEAIEDRMSIRKNTWQAAMYQALIDCDWYWEKYIPTLLNKSI